MTYFRNNVAKYNHPDTPGAIVPHIREFLQNFDVVDLSNFHLDFQINLFLSTFEGKARKLFQPLLDGRHMIYKLKDIGEVLNVVKTIFCFEINLQELRQNNLQWKLKSDTLRLILFLANNHELYCASKGIFRIPEISHSPPESYNQHFQTFLSDFRYAISANADLFKEFANNLYGIKKMAHLETFVTRYELTLTVLKKRNSQKKKKKKKPFQGGVKNFGNPKQKKVHDRHFQGRVKNEKGPKRGSLKNLGTQKQYECFQYGYHNNHDGSDESDHDVSDDDENDHDSSNDDESDQDDFSDDDQSDSSDDQNNDSDDYQSESSDDPNDVFGQIHTLRYLDFDQNGDFGVPFESQTVNFDQKEDFETSFESQTDFDKTDFHEDDFWYEDISSLRPSSPIKELSDFGEIIYLDPNVQTALKIVYFFTAGKFK